jgi:hypothetical protein
MFGFKKKKEITRYDIGSEVWFCATYEGKIALLSGVIIKICLENKKAQYCVESPITEYTRRGEKESFFKSKNECIDHWVNYLQSQREKE